MTSVLTGEQYRDFEDPQHNTHCQRTWVYGGDPLVKIADNGLRQTLEAMGGTAAPEAVVGMYRQSRNPKARIGDGPTTIPLESTLKLILDGERDFFPLLSQNGAYRKKRSSVTKVANEQINFR